MTKPIPDLLRVDDVIRAGELFHGETSVQVNPYLLVCLIRQLTAIERLFRFRVKEVQIVRFADLRQTI